MIAPAIAAKIVPAVGTALAGKLAPARDVDLGAALGDLSRLNAALNVAPVRAPEQPPRREERLDHAPAFPAPAPRF